MLFLFFSFFKEKFLETAMIHFQLHLSSQNSSIYPHSVGKECEKCGHHSGQPCAQPQINNYITLEKERQVLKLSTFLCHIFSSFSFPSRLTLFLFLHFPNLIFNSLNPDYLLTEEIGKPMAFYETLKDQYFMWQIFKVMILPTIVLSINLNFFISCRNETKSNSCKVTKNLLPLNM